MLSSGSPASTIFRRALFATTAALGVAVLGGVAHADIIYQTGNNPQGNEQEIQFEAGLTGITNFMGDTNMSNSPIEFNLIPGAYHGETDIGTVGQGQAAIICTAGCGTYAVGGANGHQLTDLEIKLGQGLGATDFIGNLDYGEGWANVQVMDQLGNTFNYQLGQGQNYFTITAINNEVITDIQITEDLADTGMGNPFGFNDFKQPRISGLCVLTSSGSCRTIPVPEPSSLALLGAGLFAAGWFSMRKKSGNFA
jgi:hypothetical protein